MTRTFIQSSSFERSWDRLGLTDAELRILEIMILDDPKRGVVVPGTGKLRKMRFPIENRGKRSGLRIMYVDLQEWGTVLLIAVFAKSEKADLSRQECHELRKAIERIEQLLEEQKSKRIEQLPGGKRK